MAAFPSNAVLLREGFGIRRPPAVSRTPFEDGMVKQLKTKSRVLVTYKTKYGFRSKTDYLAFITWFRTDINEGADWFDWTDPVSGTTKTARITEAIEEESPDDPQLTWWTVSLTIETWSA